MIVIKSFNEICKMVDGNKIEGEFPNLKNSEIRFNGKNNILYCEPEVVMTDSVLTFNGDNSIIFLGRNRHEYKLGVSLHNDSVYYIGKNCYINQKMTVILSEQRHCFIGDNCLFSWGVCIRNSDPHLVYDCETRKRINPTKSVYIGDHVWIGQDCLILKGTEIDSGSIIGGMSVVANKKIPNNTSWVGNPVRQIRSNIFWDGDCVHSWKKEKTSSGNCYDDYIAKFHKDYKNYQNDGWIYKYDSNEEITYEDIECNLNKDNKSVLKLEYLIQLAADKKKNRFVHLVNLEAVSKFV